MRAEGPNAHPLIQFARERQLTRKQVRILLDIPESTFRQLVTANCRTSWDRARGWEALLNGAVKAEHIMRWQDEHCQSAA